MNNFKDPVGRRMSRRQSDINPPEMKMVSVAVLPPRLPAGMAPPTGVAMSGAVGWEEALNYQHNDPINPPEPSKAKAFMRKTGLTTQRKKKNPDLPPFTFRQVPYDVWRKHYAKDAEGNYRGTHAPAQDCLLKPDDVRKWRFDEDPKTKADQWTRGTEVLPVYAEVEGLERVPDYEFEHAGMPPEPHVDDYASIPPPLETDEPAADEPATDARTGKVIADGKTAQQIIDEAKAKSEQSKGKSSWRTMLKKGTEMAILGGGV